MSNTISKRRTSMLILKSRYFEIDMQAYEMLCSIWKSGKIKKEDRGKMRVIISQYRAYCAYARDR